MTTASAYKTETAQTLEAASARALDLLYGNRYRTERTLALAFLAMALGILLQSMVASTTCAI